MCQLPTATLDPGTDSSDPNVSLLQDYKTSLTRQVLTLSSFMKETVLILKLLLITTDLCVTACL